MKAKQPHTDGDIAAICRRINIHLAGIGQLIMQVRDGGHPNASILADDLYDQCHALASAEAVASHYLAHPERWLMVNGYALYSVRSDDGKFVMQRYAGSGKEVWVRCSDLQQRGRP